MSFFSIKQVSSKYKKVIILAFIIWGCLAFGLGNLIGWIFSTKATLDEFPQITKMTEF